MAAPRSSPSSEHRSSCINRLFGCIPQCLRNIFIVPTSLELTRNVNKPDLRTQMRTNEKADDEAFDTANWLAASATAGRNSSRRLGRQSQPSVWPNDGPVITTERSLSLSVQLSSSAAPASTAPMITAESLVLPSYDDAPTGGHLWATVITERPASCSRVNLQGHFPCSVIE